MADDSASDDVAITFNIKSSNDAKYTVTIPLSNTVLQLKEKLSGKDLADLPPERQRLIYSGRVLKDADTLSSYKIKEGNTVHLVKGAASNQRQNPASQSTSAAPAPVPGVPQNMAAGAGSNNMLAGLTGARYAGLANLPNANMFGPDGGMGPPPDPEQLISMLENPAFASTLNEALANPQVIETMIQQNPMLRNMGPEMRQMMQSPEFRRMMTDPQMMRQTMQMQRMFGGGLGGLGDQQGNSAFPAPGATDTTEGSESARESRGDQAQSSQQQQQQQPANPFAMFGGSNAFGVNPLAQFLNPANATNPSAAAPNTSATAGNEGHSNTTVPSATTGTDPAGQPGQQQQPNPFANLANSPLFQNPQLMADMMQALYPSSNSNNNNNNNNGDNSTGGTPGNTASQQNPFAAMLQAMGAGGAGGGTGSFNPWAFGGGSAPPNNPPDNRPPEERYSEQLRQLNDMGFYDFDRNIEALRRTGGSVQGAVEYLLTNPGS